MNTIDLIKSKTKKSMNFCVSKAVDLERVFLSVVFLPILFILAVVSRSITKKVDIGIGPCPMINNVYFKKALEKKGYVVETFADSVYYITNEFDFIYTSKRNRLFWYVPALLFVRAMFRYRCVYIYFNGFIFWDIPFLRGIEPVLLRTAAIKVVVMPYGSDSQVFKYTSNKLMQHALCLDYPNFFKYSQKDMEKNITRWIYWSSVVIAHQDSVDYLPYWDRTRWSVFGVDTDVIKPIEVVDHKSIRIFHAPNHRSIKGSQAVESAIKTLKCEGYDIEYVYAHGVSNKEVIELIQSCDIVVDQLIMGAYSMFSIEAMSCGKPVICYIRKDLEELYESMGVVKPGELPLISATVLTIEDVLRNLLDKKDELQHIGELCRSYAVKYHSLEALGNFFDDINKSIGIAVK